MSETSTLIGYSGRTIGREELTLVPTPAATETHRPIPHHEIVQALVETLGFRHIGVVHDEYAVSPDGMKVFGVLDLATEMAGCRFSIGLRNSHDKSMRLAMTCGYRVFVCSNMAFAGDFTPVLAKHSKSFSLIDCISVGVDRMQRNFDPMRKQVETWQRSEVTDVTAKVVIYEAFVEGRLEAPKHLARSVHELYFEPLRFAKHNGSWTKPLRGRNPHDVQFVTSGIHLVSLLRLVPQQAPFAEPWSRCLQLIPSDRGAFHDIPSATHARGHADPQFGSEHSGVVRPAGLTLRTLLQPVTRAVGTGTDSRLSGLLNQRKEVSHWFDPYRHFRASLPV